MAETAEEIMRATLDAAKSMITTGLVEGTSGNVSARLPDGNVVMTPSSVARHGTIAGTQVRCLSVVGPISIGLLHSFTSNRQFRWKEGGELEVELPRSLTDGKKLFQVEVRPRPGSKPLQIARIDVYGYRRG